MAIGFAFPQISLAQTSTVYSVNVVGFQKVVVPPYDESGGMQLLGVPFDAQPGTLDDIIGTHGHAGDNSAVADNVILYNPDAPDAEKYQIFYLRNNPQMNDTPMWRTVTPPQTWATNVFLQPNDGFWYVNRSAVSLTNVFIGDVVADEEIAINIVPGLQLISYPFSAPVQLHELGLTNGLSSDSSATADIITFYDATKPLGLQYTQYYLRPDPQNQNIPKWRYAGVPQHWATNVVIQPHQGFWYQSRAESSFMWTVSRPYSLK